MKLIDLQILFQQKSEDISSAFKDIERPSTFIIVNYLNKAVDRFLRERYLNYATHVEKVTAILRDTDLLRNLIKTTATLNTEADATTLFPYQRTTYLPDDLMLLLSVSCNYRRSAVPPIATSNLVITDFVTQEQARKLIKTDANKSLYPTPIAVYDNQFSLIVAGDSYTTAIYSIKMRYLRKHFDLSLDYVELIGTLGVDLDITAIINGSYFRSLCRAVYVNSVGTLLDIYPGDKVLKVAGYNTITDYSGWIPKVGYPYGYCDEPEFPEYIHEQLADIAVNMFVDEAKLKLVPKQKAQV